MNNKESYSVDERRVALITVNDFKYIHSQHKTNLLRLENGLPIEPIHGGWRTLDNSMPLIFKEIQQYFTCTNLGVLLGITTLEAHQIGLQTLPEEAEIWLQELNSGLLTPRHSLAKVLFRLSDAELELFKLGNSEYQKMYLS